MTNDRHIQLIKAIADEDNQAAFKELFHHYSQPLLSYTASIVSMPAAEEVVQDVFINLWKNRKMLHAIKNLSYYLHTASKNIAINYLNKQKKQQYINFDDADLNHKIPYINPESDLIEKDNLNQIINAIEHLPPKCQLIFKMAKEQDMTYKEISQLLNIAPKTVENHMGIALKKITETIKKCLPQYASYYKRGIK